MPSTHPHRTRTHDRMPEEYGFVQPGDLAGEESSRDRHRHRQRHRPRGPTEGEGKGEGEARSMSRRREHHRREAAPPREASRSRRRTDGPSTETREQQQQQRGGERSQSDSRSHAHSHSHSHSHSRRHHHHHNHESRSHHRSRSHSRPHTHSHSHSHAQHTSAPSQSQSQSQSRTNHRLAYTHSSTVHPDTAQRAIINDLLARKKRQSAPTGGKKSWLDRLRHGTRSFVTECLAGFQAGSSSNGAGPARASATAGSSMSFRARPRISGPTGIAMLSPVEDGPPRHVSAPVASRTGVFANAKDIQTRDDVRSVPPPKTPPTVPPKDPKRQKDTSATVAAEYRVYVANAQTEKKDEDAEWPCTPWPRIYLSGSVVPAADEDYRLSRVVREVNTTYGPPSADITKMSPLPEGQGGKQCVFCSRPPAQYQQLCTTCSGLGFEAERSADPFHESNIQELRNRLVELTSTDAGATATDKATKVLRPPKPAVPRRSSKRSVAASVPKVSPLSPRHPLSSGSSSSGPSALSPSPSEMIVPPRTSMYAKAAVLRGSTTMRGVLNSSNNPASVTNPPLRPRIPHTTSSHSDASLRFSVAQNPFADPPARTVPLTARRARPALQIQVPLQHQSVYGDIAAGTGTDEAGDEAEDEWESDVDPNSPSSVYSRATRYEPDAPLKGPTEADTRELERLLQLKRWEKGEGWDRVMGSMVERRPTCD